ncbi:aminotransferase [Podospora australis]|uniref:Aminotransferase n=1 Tax=Podospora australis TaxID=1536484 RepID=A0AAN6X005_9PEZI|nr:aminotransferase [Podospora australis]
MTDDFRIFTSLRYDPALVEVAHNDSFGHAGWNYLNASPFYMLDFHRDRMLRAANHWKWEAAISVLTGDAGLQHLEEAILSSMSAEQKSSAAKVRTDISEDGTITVNIALFPSTVAVLLTKFFPKSLPPPGTNSQEEVHPPKTPEYEVLVDKDGVNPSAYTHFKTTQRIMYDEARQRAGITNPTMEKEVLIVDASDGTIMEGSVSSPYFWRDGKWVTPSVSENTKATWSGGQDGTSRRWALERGLVVEGKILASSLVDGEECWFSTGVRGFVFGKMKLR